jgi:two-component system LytT family sensor kinase
MILQPLVENALQHGLAPKIEGGTLTIRSFVRTRKLVLQVEDDGVGILEEGGSSGHGIGMANVAERLRVLFGDEGRMTILSRENEGTLISVELPVMNEDEIPETTGTQALAPRANTAR